MPLQMYKMRVKRETAARAKKDEVPYLNFWWQRSPFNSPLANTKQKSIPHFRIINLYYPNNVVEDSITARSRHDLTVWKKFKLWLSHIHAHRHTNHSWSISATVSWKLSDKWDIEIMQKWQWIQFKFKCVLHLFRRSFSQKICFNFFSTYTGAIDGIHFEYKNS